MGSAACSPPRGRSSSRTKNRTSKRTYRTHAASCAAGPGVQHERANPRRPCGGDPLSAGVRTSGGGGIAAAGPRSGRRGSTDGPPDLPRNSLPGSTRGRSPARGALARRRDEQDGHRPWCPGPRAAAWLERRRTDELRDRRVGRHAGLSCRTPAAGSVEDPPRRAQCPSGRHGALHPPDLVRAVREGTGSGLQPARPGGCGLVPGRPAPPHRPFRRPLRLGDRAARPLPGLSHLPGRPRRRPRFHRAQRAQHDLPGGRGPGTVRLFR